MQQQQQQQFVIEPIVAADEDAVVAFMGRFFDVDTPIGQHLQIAQQTEDQVRVHRFYLAQKCSFKAIDPATGTLLGVFLNRPLRPRPAGIVYPSMAEKFTDPKLRIIVAFFEFLDKQARMFERFADCERALEAGSLSVDSAHRGRGIAKALIRRTLQYAKEQGYPLVSCVCSSQYSIRVCESAGFREFCRYRMADWVAPDGRRPLQIGEPHADAVCYAKRM